MTVSVSGLSKTYTPRRGPAVPALRDIELSARDGELLVIVGPSGSGKTTLLRCIAGLETPDAGTISVGGSDVTRADPGARDVAMVFQEYALYPHLSVRKNIGFGLAARRASRSQVAVRVSAAAETLGLVDALDRMPSELSGGQRQRVALARAVVREPAAFLMDEPLSNLDAELRAQTRAEIRSLQRSLGTTTIYVTHDQVEAMTMGDRVVVLREGRVEQIDAPVTLYERPATSFVARFVGSPPMNLLPSSALDRLDDAATLGIRPEALRLASGAEARMKGRISLVEPIGSEAIVHVDVGGTSVLARVPWSLAPSPGSEAGLSFDDAAVYRFDAGGKAIV